MKAGRWRLAATVLAAFMLQPMLRVFAEDKVVVVDKETLAREQLAAFGASYADKAGWLARAQAIKAGILQGAELDPLPAKGDLKTVRIHKREYDGYTVENVAFASLSGFYVMGNLYCPAGMKAGQKYPALLCPHGHFPTPNGGGRFTPDMQTLCATLARMGAIAFSYDMVGWGESQQHPHEGKVLALQLWDSIRAVDFLASLPEVDEQRIGVTGASGGGTQAFLLAAVEERICLSIPVVMVSAHAKGGCVCESGMPIRTSAIGETDNVEIAAMAAPRPQLIISIGTDWTKNTPVVEYPYIKHVYHLFGAAEKVENLHLPTEQHDYGYSKRVGAYRFLVQHLGLSLVGLIKADGGVDESHAVVEQKEAMLVFPQGLPADAVMGKEAVEKLLGK